MISDDSTRWIGVGSLIKKRALNIAGKFWFGFINSAIMPSLNESVMRLLKTACLGYIMYKRHIHLGQLTSLKMAMRAE